VNDNLKILYSKNVNLFEYFDFRDYLSALLKTWKEDDPKLTHRKLCAYFGFKSPNFFLLITQKKRKISISTAKMMSKKLGHTRKQSEYFLLLVKSTLSPSLNEREEISKRILSLQRQSEQQNLEPRLYELYEHWYQVVLREVLTLPQLLHTPENLSKFFDETVSAHQVQKSLEKLTSLDLIEKKSSRWIPKETHLKTGDYFSNTFIILFHQKMLDLAKRSLSEHSGTQRYFSTLTLPVSAQSEKKMRELIDDFKTKALEISESSAEENDRVMQLNLQLFPLTQVIDETN